MQKACPYINRHFLIFYKFCNTFYKVAAYTLPLFAYFGILYPTTPQT